MLGLGLRLLATSRPEIPIRLGFHQMKHIAYHELALRDIPRAVVYQDIRKFVIHELGLIQADRGLHLMRCAETCNTDFTFLHSVKKNSDTWIYYSSSVTTFSHARQSASANKREGQVSLKEGIKQKRTSPLAILASEQAEPSHARTEGSDCEEAVSSVPPEPLKRGLVNVVKKRGRVSLPYLRFPLLIDFLVLKII
jgi:hypothetical protein